MIIIITRVSPVGWYMLHQYIYNTYSMQYLSAFLLTYSLREFSVRSFEVIICDTNTCRLYLPGYGCTFRVSRHQINKQKTGINAYQCPIFSR